MTRFAAKFRSKPEPSSAPASALRRACNSREQHREPGLPLDEERRSEPRAEVQENVVLVPLKDVSARLRGKVVNVSKKGIRVRLEPKCGVPQERQVFRIETPADRLLCEVRNCSVVPAWVEIGFEIISW